MYRYEIFTDCRITIPESFISVYHSLWFLWISKWTKVDVWTMHVFQTLVTYVVHDVTWLKEEINIMICHWIYENQSKLHIWYLRITNLKYLTHCESRVLGCSHTNFTVYCIVGMFGRGKVWWTDSFEHLAKESLAK